MATNCIVILPVLETATPAPTRKKRHRNHAHTAARRADKMIAAMSAEQFDAYCRERAREEIVKALKLAEAIERGEA
jgi:hypothetical protein